ncbi:MAG: hypothetical protein ACYDAG_14940, partial [Chloroflexota bacterium]
SMLTKAGISTSTTAVNPTSGSFTTAFVDGSGNPLYSAIITDSFEPTAFSTALAGRTSDFAAYINAGGGVLALSGAGNTSYYNFLPIGASGTAVTSPFTFTAAGTALGLIEGSGNSSDDNCCATHNSFGTPAAGSPLVVGETDSAHHPETLFATNVFVTGSGFGTAPAATTTPTAEPTTAPTTTAPTATPTPAPTSGGSAPTPAPVPQLGGSTPGTPANALGFIDSNPSLLTGGVVDSAAAVPWSTGGDMIAGTIGFSIPPQPGIPGNLDLVAQPLPATKLIIPGGPAQFSPNGTIFSVTATDQAGNPVHIFQTPITITIKPNAADLGQAGGHFASLTLGYVIDASTPAIMNPNHLPAGTFVVAPPSDLTADPATGLISFKAQAITATFVVLTNPVEYVQTLTNSAPELSSFGANAQTFGTKPQFSYLKVTEPQIGTRLLVLDPATGNYAYVNATDIGPSGPPPGSGSR